jgi:hypothetical protein
VAGIDRLAGSGASLEQLGELEEKRVGVAPAEVELPVGVINGAAASGRSRSMAHASHTCAVRVENA